MGSGSQWLVVFDGSKDHFGQLMLATEGIPVDGQHGGLHFPADLGQAGFVETVQIFQVSQRCA